MLIEDMDVFKLAHELTLEVYRLTTAFPDAEKYGLVSQMRRAAASVCMNLAEGAHRFGTNEYRHFVGIARGSCGEIKYQLKLANDLSYLTEADCKDLSVRYERVSMMLTKLHSSLK
jgi:four helix bundle protein